MSSFIWIALGGVVLTIGDLIFRLYWQNTSQWWLYAAGFVVYSIASVLLIESFRNQNIAVASIIYTLINIVLFVSITALFFGEKLSLLKLSGIALALVAILILELAK